MSTIKDGGPAFPMQEPQSIHAYAFAKVANITDADERDRAYIQARAEAVGGMSLRDYFAAKALPAVFETAMQEARDGSGLFQYPDWRTGIALDAYQMADAMLAARAKGGA